MLEDIYAALISDSYIEEHTRNRIKFYKYPEAASLDEPHIIIDPLDVPIPKDFADNTWLTDDYIYQIESWSHDPYVTKELSRRIRMVMWDLGFVQGSGTDEYDSDFDIYRDARRYTGRIYRDDFEQL